MGQRPVSTRTPALRSATTPGCGASSSSRSNAAGQPARARCFIASNITVLTQCERHLIPPVQQAFAVERVDVKGRFEPTGSNPLGSQVDRYFHARLFRGETDQLSNFSLREFQGEQPAAKAVALEDVAERRRDHDP